MRQVYGNQLANSKKVVWVLSSGFIGPTASVHQRPRIIAPAAVWCNAC
jgi:hypothetical protein